MRKMSALSIGLCSVLAMTNTPLNSQELTAVQEEAAIKVDGAKEPHRIPTYLKMQGFFSFCEHNSDRLASSLGANDQKLLREFAAQNGSRRDVEYADYIQTITPVCGSVDNLDAASLANVIEKLTEEWNERKTDRYLRILATLSPEGRETVEDFIAAEITPSISYSSSDVRVLAAKAPEDASTSSTASCPHRDLRNLVPRIVSRPRSKSTSSQVRRYAYWPKAVLSSS